MSGRLARLIKLLGLLSSGYAYNAEFLANSLGCSRRSIFRDIRDLKSCGQDIYFDEQWGGYLLNRSNKICPSELLESEVLALIVSASISPLAQSLHYMPGMNQAISKILARFPDDSRERISRQIRILRRLETNGVKDALEVNHFAEVMDAIKEKNCVRINYSENNSAGIKSTKLSIYQIVLDGSEVVLVGRSSAHRRVVSILLRSIASISQLNESYRIPQSYINMKRGSKWTDRRLDGVCESNSRSPHATSEARSA